MNGKQVPALESMTGGAAPQGEELRDVCSHLASAIDRACALLRELESGRRLSSGLEQLEKEEIDAFDRELAEAFEKENPPEEEATEEPTDSPAEPENAAPETVFEEENVPPENPWMTPVPRDDAETAEDENAGESEEEKTTASPSLPAAPLTFWNAPKNPERAPGEPSETAAAPDPEGAPEAPVTNEVDAEEDELPFPGAPLPPPAPVAPPAPSTPASREIEDMPGIVQLNYKDGGYTSSFEPHRDEESDDLILPS